MASQRKVTVMSSGGDYSSLTGAINGEQANLVTDDVYLDVEISGTWSSSDTSRPDTSTGYTKDSTHYINIYTVGDSRHTGVWKSDGHILYNETFALHITTSSYTRWDGLQIKDSYGSNDLTGMIIGQGNDTYVKNCLITSGSGSRQNGIVYGNVDSNLFISNNIIYGMNKGISTIAENQRADIYNNTIVNCASNGIVTNPSSVLYNNIVYNCSTDYSLTTGSWGTTGNNISSDTTSPQSALQEITLTFAASGSNNFHLASTDTDAIDGGTDLGTTGLANIDIDGRDRDAQGDTWDIGADEYVAASTQRTTAPLPLFYRPVA